MEETQNKRITDDWLDTIFEAYNYSISPDQFEHLMNFIDKSTDNKDYKQKYMNKLMYRTLETFGYKKGLKIYKNLNLKSV